MNKHSQISQKKLKAFEKKLSESEMRFKHIEDCLDILIKNSAPSNCTKTAYFELMEDLVEIWHRFGKHPILILFISALIAFPILIVKDYNIISTLIRPPTLAPEPGNITDSSKVQPNSAFYPNIKKTSQTISKDSTDKLSDPNMAPKYKSRGEIK